MSPIIACKLEANSVLAAYDICSVNLAPPSGNSLVYDCSRLSDCCSGQPNEKISSPIYFGVFSSLELQLDLASVGSLAHHKVIFQLPVITPINNVNTRVDLLVFHSSERREVGA